MTKVLLLLLKSHIRAVAVTYSSPEEGEEVLGSVDKIIGQIEPVLALASRQDVRVAEFLHWEDKKAEDTASYSQYTMADSSLSRKEVFSTFLE